MSAANTLQPINDICVNNHGSTASNVNVNTVSSESFTACIDSDSVTAMLSQLVMLAANTMPPINDVNTVRSESFTVCIDSDGVTAGDVHSHSRVSSESIDSDSVTAGDVHSRTRMTSESGRSGTQAEHSATNTAGRKTRGPP